MTELAATTDRTYPCLILGNHDGDTVRVSVDLGVSVWLIDCPLRLEGVNCPELNQPGGLEAKAYVVQWLREHGGQFVFVPVGKGRDKYGRLLGRLRAADGNVLNDDLLAAGHAVSMKD
jgi:endonuclease YncB( thermonuclease family)